MVEFFRSFLENSMNLDLTGVSDSLIMVTGIVLILIVIVSIFALIVQLYLAIKYSKFNKKLNSADKTGEEVARKILDDNELQNIKVTSTGSLFFGNSYSHYFKKVRLRRFTWQKKSVSSLAMAAQKACLAVLDKEKDPDMVSRVKLTPLISFGPLLFVPLIIVGVALDIIMFNAESVNCTIICSSIGLVFYLISFIMAIKVYKTEIKAQEKAYEVLKKENLANEEELDMLKKLFKLYNIEYINNMVIALLELIYRILQIVLIILSKKKD